MNGVVKKYNKNHKKTLLTKNNDTQPKRYILYTACTEEHATKNLQYIMGHANITITLDLYAHA